MKKFLTTIGLAASLGAGAFALNAVLPAGAQPASVSSAADGSSSSSPTGPSAGGGHPLQNVLDKLVANGTITADQEKAIQDAVKADFPGGLGKGRVAMVAKGALKTAADTIGIDPKELRTDLKGGQTVTQVATAHNVEPQKVIDAIVAKGDARLDQAVTNGHLSADQAAKAKAKLPDVVNELVDTPLAGR
jgi:hypothetical protein